MYGSWLNGMNKYIDKENECSKSVMTIQTKPDKENLSSYDLLCIYSFNSNMSIHDYPIFCSLKRTRLENYVSK